VQPHLRLTPPNLRASSGLIRISTRVPQAYNNTSNRATFSSSVPGRRGVPLVSYLCRSRQAETFPDHIPCVIRSFHDYSCLPSRGPSRPLLSASSVVSNLRPSPVPSGPFYLPRLPYSNQRSLSPLLFVFLACAVSTSFFDSWRIPCDMSSFPPQNHELTPRTIGETTYFVIR